jgi:DNA polymerase
MWNPGDPDPEPLLQYVRDGGILAAWNVLFEWAVWNYRCVPLYEWPELPIAQLYDTQLRSAAWGLSGSLGKIAKFLGAELKLDSGSKLIQTYSVPCNPTKTMPNRKRKYLTTADRVAFNQYCAGDVVSEASLAAIIPDLSPQERAVYDLDMRINTRGVRIDTKALNALIKHARYYEQKYTAELILLTSGAVQGPGEVDKITAWCRGLGVKIYTLGDKIVTQALRGELPDDVRRVLQLRKLAGGSGYKKLFSLQQYLCPDDRVRGLFRYHKAGTGRWVGVGPQPQNMQKLGPPVALCDKCGHHSATGAWEVCAWCGGTISPTEWGFGAAEDVILIAQRSDDLEYLERVFGDPLNAIGGTIRSLYIASEGCEFVCSDYSAIEARVAAVLAGEQWRIDVFNSHGKIYEMSASLITGVPFEEFIAHKKRTGKHHPLRVIGKLTELYCGYQGSVGAIANSGNMKYFESEQSAKESVKAWRKKSPAIVKMWYGLEDAARAAIQQPGKCFAYRDITYGVLDDVLYCKLPSGRLIAYHKPRLHPDETPWGKQVLKISYATTTKPTTGQWEPIPAHEGGGWRIYTYGGCLFENVVQGVSRDILAHAMLRLEAAGYNIVLHVHDEACAEIPQGRGSVEEFEGIMQQMPEWAADWPIKAAGGWIGKRFRK